MVAVGEPAKGRLPPGVTIRAIETTLLSVPLREPFVIATGRIDVTRAVLVRATLDIRLTGEPGLGVRPR